MRITLQNKSGYWNKSGLLFYSSTYFSKILKLNSRSQYCFECKFTPLHFISWFIEFSVEHFILCLCFFFLIKNCCDEAGLILLIYVLLQASTVFHLSSSITMVLHAALPSYMDQNLFWVLCNLVLILVRFSQRSFQYYERHLRWCDPHHV